MPFLYHCANTKIAIHLSIAWFISPFSTHSSLGGLTSRILTNHTLMKTRFRISAKEAMQSAYFAKNFCSPDIHKLHPTQSVAKAIQELRTTLL